VFILNKPFPLIIFKHTVNQKFPPGLAKRFEGSYNCGWLMGDDCNESFILQWGNSKNKEVARKLMDDVFEKQGERPVLFYDKEIILERSKAGIIALTPEIHNDIITTAEKWH
jgi:hypothetical protein